ncbi:MAG: hypothetical protein M1830_002022 [Pleopsidium flavum]|nr:MAG: hypothetical protein M1830_002022 [Pleopsidium flavum]
MAAMGPYLAKTGYKMPQSGKDCPFQYGHHTPLTYFEWLNANPLCGKRFMSHMAGFRRGQTSWVKPDFYPVEERLVKGMNKDKDAVLLVDVGGAEGFDIEEFRSQHPQAPGRYIVQDQSEILNRITKTPTFEPMVHDFFTPQPIIGARAYFMRMILHDWSDEKAREILSNLKSAMTPGYSKILINEMVIPDKGAHWVSTALDMFMMTLLASRERTETQWRELVATVGLKATGIWTKEAGAVSLIECEVA